MTPSLEKIRDIVSAGLCHRCGSCAGICSADVLAPDADYYPRSGGREGDCTDCGLCVRVCPGIAFSFPDFSGKITGRETAIREDHGVILKAFLGYSTDPEVRGGSTSGGIATQIPLYLLKSGKAAGAFTVGLDPVIRWKPKAFVARTRAEILRGCQSKYPACSMNQLWGDLADDEGPFAFTGLPCHVHGVRKMEVFNKSIRGKVAVSVGLICHSCLDHQVIRDICEAYSIDGRDIERMEYRGGKLPGYIRARMRGGNWAYLPYPYYGPDRYRPNAKECLTLFFKFYSPPRCRLCIDATSEFADIAVGDPWFKGWEAEKKLTEGYSLVFARTERGLRVLEEAQEDGAVVLEEFPLEKALTSHGPMVRSKRKRAFLNIARRTKRGLPVPDYGYRKRFDPKERFTAAVHVATYFAADRPRLRRMIVRFLLSRPGRLVVAAAFFRKRVLAALWWKHARRPQ